MGLTFVLIWSSAFTSARIIVQAAPPLMISSLRFALAGAVAIGLGLILGQSMRLSRKQWRAVIIFGLCQNAIYLGLNFVAMQTIEASLATIIASSLPLIVAVLSVPLLGERPSALGIFGLIAGLLGIILIMNSRITGGSDMTAILLCVIAACALAIATLTVRNMSNGDNLWIVVGLQMWVGSVALFFPSYLTETWQVEWSQPVLLAFIYTIVFPGIIATYIWFKLVNRVGATKAASFHFLNPFFGVAIAALLLSETISLTDGLGVVIIMAGILAVQVSRIRKRA